MLAFRKDSRELQRQIRQLKKQLALSEKERHKFQLLAERDFLTGIYNRHGFVRETERFLDELRSEQRPGKRRSSSIVSRMALLFIDVDDLKVVNDMLGHKKGDAYLQAIARTLVRTVRGIDIVGRWGGDEFVVVLINASDRDAIAVAHKLKQRIERLAVCKSSDIDFTCSASFGLISVGGGSVHPSNDLFSLVEKADKAMYEAKIKRGKGVIVNFDDLQHEDAV